MATSSYVIASMHSTQFYIVIDNCIPSLCSVSQFLVRTTIHICQFIIFKYNYLFSNGSNLDMYGVFNQKIISRNILPNIFVNNGE